MTPKELPASLGPRFLGYKRLGHCCRMSPVWGIPSLPPCWAGVAGQKS